MNVNINTSEKFTTITPETDALYDNLSPQLIKKLRPYLSKEIKNVILNMKNVHHTNSDAIEDIANLQQEFYENSASFVICNVHPNVMHVIEKLEMEEDMNITPTESEAWDIVQMEEIERELQDDDEPLFNDFEEDEEEYED